METTTIVYIIYILVIVLLAIDRARVRKRMTHIAEIAKTQNELYTQTRSDIARLKEEHRKEIWSQGHEYIKRENKLHIQIKELKNMIK
jgi:ABC-type bacteriocin/lantibiotic exporter with double-glycine peptidase domain